MEQTQKTQKRFAFYFILLVATTLTLFIAGVSGYFRLMKAEKAAANLETINQSLTGKLITIKNKNGTLTAGRVALQGENKNFLKIIAGQNQRIAELQRIVKEDPKNTALAAVVRTETKTIHSVVTVIDTATQGKKPGVLPTYTGRVETEFEKIEVTARPDSVIIKSEHYETGEIKQLDYREKWYKPKKQSVFYTSRNPKTTVTDVNAYIVQQPKGQRLKDAAKGAGILTAVVLILKTFVIK